MYRLVVLVICYQTSSHPVTDEPRIARQLTECCPCPSDAGAGLLAGSPFARAGGLDDCPCLSRGADSEGASSLFFPSTLRADRPAVRNQPTKEESKNLLEPEVALATSMLDTLREATEEEYQDALARDAAKNVADDAAPEESARNVVIIMNPSDLDNSDDIISEASHVQESRCVHPLDSTPLGRMRSSTKPINILPETLSFPKLSKPGAVHKNLLHIDSNVEASNAEESIIDTNRNRPRYLSRSPAFNLPTPLTRILDNIDETNIAKNGDLSLGQTNEKTSKMFNIAPNFALNPNFKSHRNVFGKEPASSILEALPVETDDKLGQLFRKSNFPLNVRNFLKLRDVEFIPKSSRSKAVSRTNLDVPNFKIPTLWSKNKNEDSPDKNCDEESDIEKSLENVQNEPSVRVPNQNNEHPTFKIGDITSDQSDLINGIRSNLDTLSSPSQMQLSIINSDDDFKRKDLSRDLPENIHFCDTESQQDDAKASNSNFSVVETTTVSEKEIDKEGNENRANVDDSLVNNENTITHTDVDYSSSNNIPTFVTLDEQEREATDLIPQNDVDVETVPIVESEFGVSRETNDKGEAIVPENTVNEPTSSLSETLSIYRKNIYEKIKNLKTLPVKNQFMKPSTLSQNKESKRVSDEEIERNDNNSQNQHNDDSKEFNDEDTTSPETDDTTNDVTMNDLQKMSDKLLDLNSKSLNEKKIVEAADDSNLETSKSDSADNSASKIKLDPNMESTQINIVNSHTNSDIENACLLILNNSDTTNTKENVLKSAGLDNAQVEMDTGASDTVINTLPSIFDSLNSNLKLRSPLLEDIIVQPTSDPLNLFGKPIVSGLNLNTNLPTLDELRERLANMFTAKERSVEEDSFSLENDDVTHQSSLETMASESSTNDYRRKLPSVKDINMKIFRNKPLTSKFPDQQPTPKINLNSYRSKAPVPSNFDLKPVKLESGASSLSNGSIRKPLLRKAKPSNTINKFNPDIFPTIEDLRNSINSKPKNVFGISKHPEPHILSQNLRSNDVEDIANTIRLNTEKTIKGLQRKMKSSLKNAQSHGPFGETIAKPHELLDDMNDKLKAIHYDLNDRLSSIHEDIFDSSRINYLTDHFRSPENRNVMTNLRPSKARPAPAKLRTAASTITAHKVDPYTPLRASDTDKDSNMFWNSAMTARDELPMSSLSDLQKTHPLRLNPTQSKYISERTLPQDLQRVPTSFDYMNKPTFRTPLSHLNRNKVTISFGSTTAAPVSPSGSFPFSRTPVTRPQTEGRSSWQPSMARDSASFKNKINKNKPTEISYFRNTAQKLLPDDEIVNFGDSDKSNLRSPVFRQIPSSNTLDINRPKSSNLDESWEQPEFEPRQINLQPLKPKDFGDSFMSRARGALNMRQSKMGSKPAEDVNTEMLRSPSENKNVIIEEPLKENVSYRCRMVCTKEYT